MAGQEGLEPPASGFGVRRSTIRATGLPTACESLPDFFVHCVLTAKPTILAEFVPVLMLALVARRRVVATATVVAG